MQLKIINNVIKFTEWWKVLSYTREFVRGEIFEIFFFYVFPYKNIYIYILHNIRKASIIYALRLYRE